MTDHDVPADLVELYEILEYEAMLEGFADLTELRDVLIMEGRLDD